MTNRQGLLALALCALVLATGCSRIYYSYLEKVGIPKRDVLVNRVSKARDDQEKAKQQFTDALEQFRSVVAVDAGDLDSKYAKLKSEFDRSESRADKVRERIDEIESVAKALFREWEAELDQYSNPALRRSSEEQLDATRAQYDRLVTTMRRASASMDPVLDAFRDQVLYLKHNLNAAAIASLQGEVVTLESEIANLVSEMENSIAEADAFISQMESARG